MQDFLKKLNRQRDKCQRKAKIDGSQYPAGGVHGIFKEAFHKVLFAKETSAQYISTALAICKNSTVHDLDVVRINLRTRILRPDQHHKFGVGFQTELAKTLAKV